MYKYIFYKFKILEQGQVGTKGQPASFPWIF